jgi:NAD(P)-dependent dehydrogenase (short-subunit alcohol dehydrogenase family)
MFPPASAVTKHGHDLQVGLTSLDKSYLQSPPILTSIALFSHPSQQQFGCNVLGHYHLTTVLLPLLLASPNKSSGFPRVVNTSSIAHVFLAPKGGIIFDNLKVVEGTDRPKVGLGVMPRYGQSKIGNVLFANELDRRYRDKGLVSSSCNPGNLDSDCEYRSTTTEGRLGAFGECMD